MYSTCSIYQVLNATVLSFCIFTNGDQIDIFIGSWVPLNRATGSDIGKQIKCPKFTRKINGSWFIVRQGRKVYRDFSFNFFYNDQHTFLMLGLKKHGPFQF